MLIKNITATRQELQVIYYGGDNRKFTISVEPLGTAEIIGARIVDAEKLKGVFSIVTGQSVVEEKKEEISETPIVPETPVVEEAPVQVTEESENTEETVSEAPETVADKITCSICGAEFGSDRGLSMHMSRAHAE